MTHMYCRYRICVVSQYYYNFTLVPLLGAAETLEGVNVLSAGLSAPALLCQLAWGCVEAAWSTG